MNRFLLLSLVILMALTTRAASKMIFTITGKTTPGSQKIVISKFATGVPVATVSVDKDGNFTYTDSGTTGKILKLSDQKGGKQNLVINDGSDMKLDMTQDKIENSQINEELYTVAHHVYSLHRNKQDDEARSYLLERIEANKSNCAPIYWIYRYYHVLGHDKVKELMHSNNTYSKHPAKIHVDAIMKRIDIEQSLIGTHFKDFKLPGLNGEKHRLSDFIGKGNYVLVDFWASWCKPCREEIPLVRESYERYHSKGFEIIGISLDKKKEDCISVFRKINMPWLTLIDISGTKGFIAKAYSIHSIPFNLLFDGSGNVVDVNLHGKALNKKLKEIFPE